MNNTDKVNYKGYIKLISTAQLQILINNGHIQKPATLYFTHEKNCYMLYHSQFKDSKGYNRVLRPIRIWNNKGIPYNHE